jgi:hypothetical protein
MAGAWTDKIMKHGGAFISMKRNVSLAIKKLYNLGVEKTFWRLRYEQKIINFH